jgi:hypothetical protein
MEVWVQIVLNYLGSTNLVSIQVLAPMSTSSPPAVTMPSFEHVTPSSYMQSVTVTKGSVFDMRSRLGRFLHEMETSRGVPTEDGGEVEAKDDISDKYDEIYE